MGLNNLTTGAGTSRFTDIKSDNINNSATITTTTVETQDLIMTGEDIVSVRLSSDQQYATANGFVKVEFDDIVVDKNSIFDTTTNTFSPSEAGSYLVNCAIQISNFSDQDDVILRMVNGSGTVRVSTRTGASGSARETLRFSKEVEFGAARTLSVEFRNINSDDNIKSSSATTYLTLSRLEEN
jgi:hypothetical protein